MALTKLSAGGDAFWLLNDVPHQRGQFDVSARIGQDVVEIYSLNTLKSLARGRFDEFSPDGVTPYASTQALIDDLKTFFFRSVAGGGGGTITEVNGDVGPVVNLENDDIPNSFRFLQNWTPPTTTHPKNTLTELGGWLSIALIDTKQYPVPRDVGEPFYIFDGTLVNQNTNAKQLLIGTRYLSNAPSYLKGYRLIDIVAGNKYEVYSVKDPLGTPIISLLTTFTAATSGELEFNIPVTLLGAGIGFDVFYKVVEPDPTPTTFNGDWDYQTSSGEVVPLAGQITQRTNQSSPIRVSKTDNNAGDRSAELAGLSVGDVIVLGDIRWAIQGITDNGTDLGFDVLPEVVSSITGVQNFVFETVASAPITYGQDTDYYLGNANVRGLFVADDGYDNIVENNNAYGVDILVQKADIPTEWSLLSYTGQGGVSSGGTNLPAFPTTDLRYKLVVQNGVMLWQNDQTALFSLPFVKSQNLNSPQILETHSSFSQPSCYTIGGTDLQAELIGFALCATSASAGIGQDLDVRFYEFTATGGPRGFNGGTLLYQSNNGEFPDNQGGFNYYGKDIFFDNPILLTQGVDQRLFCDVNPFGNWNIQDIEVRALVRLTLLPTP
jgi:hypothetical protein